VPHDPSKLTNGLFRAVTVADRSKELSVIVRFRPDRARMRHQEHIRGTKASYYYRLMPFVHMHATPDGLECLEADPDVVMIYQDLPVRAFLDTSPARIAVPPLWSEGLSGLGVRIAVVDTGIDRGHPDLSDRILDATDFTGEGPDDGHGHGTHCASVAAGSGSASEGRYRGIAPGAQVLSAKVLRNDGDGMMSDVMAGIEWAVDKGAQVISLSLGGTGPSDGRDALSETCNAAVEYGVAVCVAAGNDGPRPYSIGAPGTAERVITIGACDDQDAMAAFSSRGPTMDGRAKPDVVLPGVDIAAARASGTAMGTTVDAHYTSASGTSMAAPHAAGVCALLLEAEPDISPDQIKARLMATAVDVGVGPYDQGSGRVDAYQARHTQDVPTPTPTPEEPGPGPTPGQGCLFALLETLFLGKRN